MKKLKINDLDAIVFDFDGVLTDNTVYVFEDGREAVRCNRSDGLAIDMLRKSEIPLYILSTEKNEVVKHRGMKLKIPVIQGIKDKGKAINELIQENDYSPDKIIFVGNDINDLSAMEIVAYPIAVADAHPLVKNIAWKILVSNGGDAIVREIIDNLIEFKS